MISISSHNLSFPFNQELGEVGSSPFEILHTNKKPIVKSSSNKLEIIIKSLNNKNEFTIYRSFRFLKSGFKLIDKVITNERRVLSNVNFTPDCKLVKKSDSEILISKKKKKWMLKTPSCYKINFKKQLISSHFLKKCASTSLLIEGLSKKNVIEYSFFRI